MIYYLVMDQWNAVVCRLTDYTRAVCAARACGGYIVPVKARPKYL